MMNMVSTDNLRKLIPSSLKKFLASIVASNLVGWVIRQGREYLHVSGCKIFIKHPRISNKEVASLLFGIRERAEVNMVKNLLSVDDQTTVVELGSSIGYVASVVAKRQPKRMVLVEPDAELISIAKRNVQANGSLELAVDFGNVAVSYSGEAFVEFFSGETTTSGKTVGSVRSDAESSLVEALTLSKLLTQFQVDDYVLISDIEGAEADIWFDDEVALLLCKSIVVELEETEKYSISDQLMKIESLGFSEQYSYGRVFLFTRPLPHEGKRA